MREAKFLLAILSVYVVMAGATAYTKLPWVDEAWFYSPAHNLAHHGVMSTTVFESEGTPYTRLNERTYWQPPLHFLTLAAAMQVFPEGLLLVRFLSVFWGATAILALFAILRCLFKDPWVAHLGAFLLAIDYAFLLSASDGRMDMQCAAWGLVGLALIFEWRERGSLLMLYLGHFSLSLSILTHLNGLGYLLLAAIIMLSAGRAVRSRAVWFVPMAIYVVLLGMWGLYLAQDFDAFLDQFRANLGDRLSGVWSLGTAFRDEVMLRYGTLFGFGHPDGALGRMNIIPYTYLVGIIAALIVAFRNRGGVRQLAILTTALFAFFAFILGNKTSYYLCQIVPLYAGLIAATCVALWNKGYPARVAVTIGLFALVVFNGIGSWYRIKGDDYHTKFTPIVDRITQMKAPNQLVMGSAEYAFGIGFDGELIDDPGLGCRTDRSPDWVIVTSRYRSKWEERSSGEVDEIDNCMDGVLMSRMRVVFQDGSVGFYGTIESP